MRLLFTEVCMSQPECGGTRILNILGVECLKIEMIEIDVPAFL